MNHPVYHYSEQWLWHHDERFKQLNILSRNSSGVVLRDSSNSLIYNNYFNNTNNVYDSGSNVRNVTGVSGINIIVGPCIDGNYWIEDADVRVIGG